MPATDYSPEGNENMNMWCASVSRRDVITTVWSRARDVKVCFNNQGVRRWKHAKWSRVWILIATEVHLDQGPASDTVRTGWIHICNRGLNQSGHRLRVRVVAENVKLKEHSPRQNLCSTFEPQFHRLKNNYYPICFHGNQQAGGWRDSQNVCQQNINEIRAAGRHVKAVEIRAYSSNRQLEASIYKIFTWWPRHRAAAAAAAAAAQSWQIKV